MLLEYAKRLFVRRSANSLTQSSAADVGALLSDAAKLYDQRRLRESIEVWIKYLKHRPHDVDALNNLGAALATVGRENDAIRYFDLAYSLDDSHLPSIANYANVLKGRCRTAEALDLLAKARIQAPGLPGMRAGYASLLFSMGEAEASIEHTLHAWLGDFDAPRAADLFLFTATYVEQNEIRLAAEHKFWANTLLPRPHEIGPALPATHRRPASVQGRKLRVGYWSPDFREHSVRYFFRPLLEGHDRAAIEIFLYHDHYSEDEQTALMKSAADHFFAVAPMSDDELAELLHSHELDVLVELAGHTSANRLDMLRYRFAALQVTGLGYPPTTGLKTIDAKLLDRHLVDPQMPALYSEAPAVLPQSFWCFDPKTEIPAPSDPPVLSKGYVTFGCFGNIGKVSAETMECWGQVLARLPGSRLVIRAVNFADPLRKSAFETSLLRSGIRPEQVELLPPTMPRDLFAAYNDIDIVLDTYPFNGGTTTCFATYSGVPVLSRKGRALASRMGESIMKNLGAEAWIVDSAQAYVDQAVRGAQDIEELCRFRREARQRFETTSLGNGEMFARDVESFYRNWLEAPPDPVIDQASHVLPAQELVRRSLIALRYGQFGVARRIVDYCLDLHPYCGAAHVLWTERLTSLGRFGEAADYLKERRSEFSEVEDQVKGLVNEARFLLLDGRPGAASEAVQALFQFQTLSYSERCQRDLLQCASRVLADGHVLTQQGDLLTSGSAEPRQIVVCIVTEDSSIFEKYSARLSELDPPTSAHMRFVQCASSEKSRTYERLVNDGETDFLVCVHANVDFWRHDFWTQLDLAFAQCDVVGCYGARRWDRLDWRTCSQPDKAGGYLIPSGERNEYWEVSALSRDDGGIATGLGVVDGCFVAVNLRALKSVRGPKFMPELEEAGPLLEEYFSHCAAREGLRVGACSRLGISLDWRVSLDDRYLGPARLFIADSLKLDPWLFPDEETTVWSVSVPSAVQAASVLHWFTQDPVDLPPVFIADH
ncbi:hypothetical protein [Paracidovorax wautersii]|uniref:protein O-GlcNAc transferase n=1 Tax=Paracidovorax wautersii TaxID=1177982 RepID=A0ABU1IA25_9BURK|nr:hypothetical protein [Paracidovorax wautersii]MDR6213428.1 protein O-GlcNAc transferase [Paracidovorax wautersii]